MTDDTFQLGLIARMLIPAKGDGEATRQAVARLVAINPTWRTNLRGNLEKFFYASFIVDRLEKDLNNAGLAKAP